MGALTTKAAVKAHSSSTPVVPLRWVLDERGDRERERAADLGAVQEPDRQDPDEEERRADERVDEELHRRGRSAGAIAPPGDEEVRRHQRQLEEQEEQEHVEAREGADGRGLEQEEPAERGARAQPLGGAEDRDRHDDRGEHDEQHRDPVDAAAPDEAERRGDRLGRGVLVHRAVGS